MAQGEMRYHYIPLIRLEWLNILIQQDLPPVSGSDTSVKHEGAI